MAEVSMMPMHGQRTGSAGLTVRPPLTLAEEHVLLLWQVAARAEKLLTAAADGRWPGAELAALAGYAQAEVLRQISDEETVLQAGTGLDPVWQEISKLSPDGHQFTVLQDGPDRWRMQVTRRQAAI